VPISPPTGRAVAASLIAVDACDLQPGDIAVFDGHTAIVAGNGQLIGIKGNLQPRSVTSRRPGLPGFYRPVISPGTRPTGSRPPCTR